MYTLYLRFGAVYWNNENVRFIFVFSSFLICLDLWLSLFPFPSISVFILVSEYVVVSLCLPISLLFLHLPVSWRPSSCLLQRDEWESRAGSFPESGSLLIEISSLDLSSFCGKRASRKWKTGFTFVFFFPSFKRSADFKESYSFIYSFIRL